MAVLKRMQGSFTGPNLQTLTHCSAVPYVVILVLKIEANVFCFCTILHAHIVCLLGVCMFSFLLLFIHEAKSNVLIRKSLKLQ